MSVLLKIYSASCLILIAFILFFALPLESLSVEPSIMALVAGGGLLGVVITYISILHRREGFEFGWFLANRGGFLVICLSGFALTLLICGLLALIIPNIVGPIFQRGAMPIASVLVICFWLAINYMFGYLAIAMFGALAARARDGKIKSALHSFVLALVCLGLAMLFFSLFIDVINEEFVNLTDTAQHVAFWTFAAVLVCIGLADGAFNGHRYREDEMERM